MLFVAVEEDSDLGLWPWGPRSMGIFCRVGSIVPSVSALWPGVLGEEHRLGFFLPKSSAPVTEEIIVFVERLNLVERSKCTFSPPLSPGPLPILPGLGAANTECEEPSTCPFSAGARAQRKELACDFACPVALLQRKPLPRPAWARGHVLSPQRR